MMLFDITMNWAITYNGMIKKEGNVMNYGSLIDKVHAMVDAKLVCGTSLALIEPDGCTMDYYGRYGVVEPYNTMVMDQRALYDMASCSKVIGTTTRILQLIDNHTIHFDDLINHYVKDYQGDTTIYEALTHTGGLVSDFADKHSLDKDGLTKRILSAPCDYPKGTKSQYSDTGFVLLGWVIEAVDGMKLDESIQKHVVEPLRLHHLGYHPCDEGHTYVPEEIVNGNVIVKTIHDYKGRTLAPAGSAGIFASLSDVASFVRSYLNQDERLFSKAMFEKIKTTEIFDRGLGWDKQYHGSTIYHTGFTGTSILMDLDSNRGMVLLTNRIHPSRQDHGFLQARRELNTMWLKWSKNFKINSIDR